MRRQAVAGLSSAEVSERIAGGLVNDVPKAPTAALLFATQLTAGHQDLRGGLRGAVAGAVAMVPEGLVLLTSVTFAVSVVRLGRRQVLVQELPARSRQPRSSPATTRARWSRSPAGSASPTPRSRSTPGLPFPFLPRQLTLVGSLTIGIPGFFLALACWCCGRCAGR
jgi:hypothetical protein